MGNIIKDHEKDTRIVGGWTPLIYLVLESRGLEKCIVLCHIYIDWL